MSDTDTDTDTLTVLKLLAKGRLPAFVADATGLPIGRVQSIADEHGWPERARISAAVEDLVLDAAAPRIPVRDVPVLSRPAPTRPASTPGAPSPVPGGTPNGVARTPHHVAPDLSNKVDSAPLSPTVDELVRACRRSELKRTQALGPKLTELAEKVTAALRVERETAEAKAKQAEEFAAKKAAVDRLAKKLAEARADLRKLKPSGVTEAALDFACGDCGDVFSTSSGRKRHITRKHTQPTTSEGTPA